MAKKPKLAFITLPASHQRHKEHWIMPVLQTILDNQIALDAAVVTLSGKVDAVLAGQSGSATAAEQQPVADALAATKNAVDAISAKLP